MDQKRPEFNHPQADEKSESHQARSNKVCVWAKDGLAMATGCA